MNKFKVGDRVRCLDGSCLPDILSVGWCESMRAYVGNEFFIEDIHESRGSIYLAGFWWCPNWLELVEEVPAKKACPSNLNSLAAEYDAALDEILDLTTKLAYAKNLLLKAKPMVTFELNEQITTFIDQLEE